MRLARTCRKPLSLSIDGDLERGVDPVRMLVEDKPQGGVGYPGPTITTW